MRPDIDQRESSTVPAGPKPLQTLASIIRVIWAVSKPRPFGSGELDHSALRPALDHLGSTGGAGMGELDGLVRPYLDLMSQVDPHSLGRNEALAFWINVYNAGALSLASRALLSGTDSVLNIRGGFTKEFVNIGGEDLSLNGVEHGKLRRFSDPRIHSALVCGSVSCPTLRIYPYTGDGLDDQLDHQMKTFLAKGGLELNVEDRTVRLSRILQWFGSDFTNPRWMPLLFPRSGRRVLNSLRPWVAPGTLDQIEAINPTVGYMRYHWALACKID